MAETHWTTSQRAAIETVGRSVLVSAGAGSGKTAVLSERCAYLVTEARPPCNIDELLVVTFTDAAAAEMRQRIAQALRRRMAESPHQARLKYQLALLDSAHVSTIHAFCRRLLNRHFAQADIDPQAPLLDPHDAMLLHQETAQRVFDHLAERKDHLGDAFLDFLAAYGAGSERALRGLVLKISGFLASLPDPDDWIKKTLDCFNAKAADTLTGFWFEQLRGSLQQELCEQIKTASKQLGSISAGPVFLAGFLPPLQAYRDALAGWLQGIEEDPSPRTIDGLCTKQIVPYRFPAIPSRNSRSYKELSEQEQIEFTAMQDRLKDVRDKLLKKRLKESFACFTCADWAEGIARTAPHVRTFLHLVQAFQKQYQAAKDALGVIDFSDLQRATLDLLRDPSAGIARQLRDQFQHVLVDEFQDVNPVQAEILRLLSHESDPRRPGNLFAVGDVKQSIYRFRLAEPQLFLKRHRDFQCRESQTDRPPGGIAIHLLENFRSRSQLIDAINAIFEKLMAPDLGGIDYDEHARLKCGRTDAEPPAGPAAELHVLQKLSPGDHTDTEDADALDWEQIQREAYVIAQRIGALIREGRRYDDMVILLRAMKAHTALLVRTLSQMGIPVFADGSGGLFDSLEVLDVLALLALLDNRQQDIPLAAVLRSPLLGRPLSDADLVEIRTGTPGGNDEMPFHAAARRYAEAGRDPALKSRLRSIFEQSSRWRHRMRRRPLADVLWQIYEESGILAHVSGLRDGPQRRANLLQLHEYARRFGDFKRQGLYRFLQFIDALDQSDSDLDAGAVAAPAGNVVRVMTVHRSKGLEFPIVILAELGKRFNMADARGAILFDRHLGMGLLAVDVPRRITYPTLPHRLVARAVADQTLAEELRVLYVALTRAKERLILVGTGRAPPEPPIGAAQDAGPLPLLERQGATGMLDWLNGAIAAQPADRLTALNNGPTKGALFALRSYTAEEMSHWQIEHRLPRHTSQKLEKLSGMELLDAPAAEQEATAIVQIVERRLTTPYPARDLTRIPAVAAASALKGRFYALQDDEEPMTTLPGENSKVSKPSPYKRQFKTPDFLSAVREPEPTSLGTWTHSLLQRLDLKRPCDLPDLKRQCRDLAKAGILSSAEVGAVDLDAVAWFFATEIGQKMRRRSTRVLREWPFTLGVDPGRYDAEAVARDDDDIMLVRGIIDLLFDAGDGWEILDYKTDKVSGEELDRRAELYAGQIRIYAAATEAVWQKRPQHCWLAFLAARQIVEV